MSLVLYEVENDIARVTLNRPERLNAVTDELIEELVGSLERAYRDRSRVTVLAANGRAFCAGHDLREHATVAEELDLIRQLERIQDVTRWIRRLDSPVIAAVRGYALGAGCEIALAADLVIASDTAVFGFPEVSVGLSVTGGISQILPSAVGPVRAKELLLTSEKIPAERARDWGLINRVVPDQALEEEVGRWATELATKPRSAMALAKHSLDATSDQGLQVALAGETLSARIAMTSDESEKGANSFRAASKARVGHADA